MRPFADRVEEVPGNSPDNPILIDEHVGEALRQNGVGSLKERDAQMVINGTGGYRKPIFTYVNKATTTRTTKGHKKIL